MKTVAKIFLSRSTTSVYTGCQFLLLYGLLPPQTSAYFIFALMCVGFIPLADLTLSVNSAAFREHAGSDPSFVTSLILVLCGLTCVSGMLVLCATSFAINPDPHTSISIAFFFMTCMVVTINMAIPLFHGCGTAFTQVIKSLAFADLMALCVGGIVGATNPEHALVVAVSIRLLLSLSALIWAGQRATFATLAAAANWWKKQVKSRSRFIAIQFVSAAAGASLFSFPGLFLLASGNQQSFVQFALAIALTNIIVSMCSSFFAVRTDFLLQSASGATASDRLFQAGLTLRVAFIYFTPIGIVALSSLIALNEWVAEYFQIAAFAAFSPLVTSIALITGFFNLCSQIVAMGQRIRGYDNFALPALLLGTINIFAVYQLGTSALAVAGISLCISIVGFATGTVFNNRSHQETTHKVA